MIPPQEYVLLKNVTTHTVDHLLDAILDGSIEAYIEWPEGRRHVPMNYTGKLSRYVRIIQPVYKDQNGNLIFSQVAVLSKDGEVIVEPKACFKAPVDGVRVRPPKDTSTDKLADPKHVFWGIVEKTLAKLKADKGKVSHDELFKELNRLLMSSDEVSQIIADVDFTDKVIMLQSGKEVSFQTVRNRYPVK